MPETNKIFYQKIPLPFKIKTPILALGSHRKNTVCFLKGDFAYLSAIHADLSQPEDFLNFKKIAKFFLKKNPKIIACDLHPEYQSSKYAQELRAKRYALRVIQHHHAHITGCMAENGLGNKKVIGVAFDGTGLGEDSNLWGGEFIICNYKEFKRQAHLDYIPLLGAEKAILEPWRLAAAWLYIIYKEKFLKLKIDFIRKINKKKWFILKKMLNSNFNSPLSSSVGRLFDAVSALVLGNFKAEYEGQAAIELEKRANRYLNLTLPVGRQESQIAYRFAVKQNEGKYIIEPSSIFKGIIRDLIEKKSQSEIAYRFHLSVAEMIKKVCLKLRKEERINKVVLSGGVFQNKILLNQTLDLLYKNRFKVFFHKNLSCSDSSISLGQAAVANFNH